MKNRTFVIYILKRIKSTTRLLLTIGLATFVSVSCNSHKNSSDQNIKPMYNSGTISNNNAQQQILSDTIKQKLNLDTFNLPTTVNNLISIYGNYSKFIFCDEPCDAGSKYEWKTKNGLIISAWAMKRFNDKANKQDTIEAYDLTAKNNNVIVNTIFGLALNKTSLAECKQQFNLKKSKIDNAWKFEQNNIFTYMWFNANGILIKIGQYPFDYDSAN